MLDPVTLATSVIATGAVKLLEKFFERAADGAADEVGKKTVDKVIEIFAGKKEGQAALQQFQQNQNDTSKDALIALLTKALDESPKQAQQLHTIVTNYNYTAGDTVGRDKVIIGVDPEKHADVLVELKLTIRELDVKNIELANVKQLSEEQVNTLKADLEKERQKSSFDEQIKSKLAELDTKNDFAGAEQLLLTDVVESYKAQLAETYFQLARYANLQLKYRDALNYYEEAIQLMPNDPQYLNEAGYLLNFLGFPKRAIVLLEQALAISISVLGKNNVVEAINYTNLGTAYEQLGNYKKAMEYYRKYYDIVSVVYGENSMYVSHAYNNMATASQRMGESENAIRFIKKAIEITQSKLGDKHTNLAVLYNNIGEIYTELQENEKAKEFLNKAIVIYGNDPVVAGCYSNLGLVLNAMGEPGAAIELFNKALSIELPLFGEVHPYIAFRYNNLGLGYQTLGENQKAKDFFYKSLEINKELFGEKHPEVARDYGNIGAAYYNLGIFKKAIENIERSERILSELYPDGNHAYLKAARQNLAHIRSLLKA